MNSRARLLAVLDGQKPDRVPISTYELAGHNSMAWENDDPSYAGLMDLIREKTDCVCMWNPTPQVTFQGQNCSQIMSAPFLETAEPVDITGVEYREANAIVTHYTIQTPGGDLAMTNKVLDDVHTIWTTEHWCKNLNDVDKALSVPFVPINYDFSDYNRIRDEVGDNGIIMSSIPDPLCLAAELMEFGEYTIWAMTETEHFARTIEVLHERLMQNLGNMLDAQVVDLYRIYGPEYATPPYLPPRLFERFVAPYVKEITDLIHSGGAKARLHSHGKINQVLDMILETGIDAIDPCESPPDGDITLARIKKRIGDRVSIFGNLQLKLLELASKEEVAKAVIECMDAAKAGGGYVIMPTAAPINTPLDKKTEENYSCFIETALEYGSY